MVTTADIIARFRTTPISIIRRTRVSDGPNSTWTETTLAPQDFSLYFSTFRSEPETVVIGGVAKVVEINLMGLITADIVGTPTDEGHDVVDEFEYGDRRYRVVYVRPYEGFGFPGLEMVQVGCISSA